MTFKNSILGILVLIAFVNCEVNIAKKSFSSFQIDNNNDDQNNMQNEHLRMNFKSKTPNRIINHELNDQHIYRVPFTSNTLNRMNNNHEYSSNRINFYDQANSNNQYLSSIQNFCAKFNQEQPVQKTEKELQQLLFNLHYHKNFVDQSQTMPQFQQQPPNGKHLLKVLVLNTPQAAQQALKLLQNAQQQSPVSVSSSSSPFNVPSLSDLLSNIPTMNREQENNKNSDNDVQYNALNLRLENIPGLGQVAHGEVNTNGNRKVFVLTKHNRDLIKRSDYDSDANTDDSPMMMNDSEARRSEDDDARQSNGFDQD